VEPPPSLRLPTGQAGYGRAGKFKAIQIAPHEWPGPRTTASHYRLPHSLWYAIFLNKGKLTIDLSILDNFQCFISKYCRRCISPLKPI
jgi:hypothetical protein